MNYTLGPLLWLLLCLIPPLIFALYFLKLRREPLEVPSTFLWKKTIEDLHVNSLWQKLRQSLLLLLQLLLVFLLIAACLSRKGCPGEELSGERFVFLLDNSASMSATDVEDSKSRFEDAREKIGNMIDRMSPGAVGMLISFSDTADAVQSYTSNKSMLKRKLAAIRQTSQGTDIHQALVAASGLANPGRTSDRESSVDVQVADTLEATIFIFSDGAVKEVPAFSLGDSLQVEYKAIGAIDPPDNCGITGFQISDRVDSGSGQIQAFARIQNSSTTGKEVSVSLYVGDELLDARSGIQIKKESSRGITFDLTKLANNLTSPLPVRLELEDEDCYMLDNRAFEVLNPPRLVNILLVTDYNPDIESTLTTPEMQDICIVRKQPVSFLESDEYRDESRLGTWELVIFDMCAPEVMPSCNTLFVGRVPQVEGWKADDVKAPTPIMLLDQANPVMYSVQLGNVEILNSTPVTGPPGSLSLMESVDGDIMVIGPRGSFLDLVMAFPIIDFDEDRKPVANTNWPIRLSFPVFMYNVVTELGGRSSVLASQGTSPGKLIKLRTRLPFDNVSVESPDGKTAQLVAGDDNAFVYAGTENPGIYTVYDPDRDVDHLFAVNLFDRRESNLAVRDSLNLGYDEIARGTAELKRTTKEYWPWIVGAAFLLLLVEWYIYNQRVLI